MLTDDIKTIEAVNSPQYSVHDNVLEAWGRIKAACNKVESATHNTGSPKFPTWEEVRNALPPAPADWGCYEETAVEIFNYGAESAYEFICRQLRASA